MKGVILAGGRGTRLFPITQVASKQLQPVYDKPMVYYPLATLLQAGIREILVITTREDSVAFNALLGDGRQLGARFEYAIQDAPNGIAEAFLIGSDFIGGDAVTLILGDNIFHGNTGLNEVVAQFRGGATIFAYPVRDPERYGVVVFDRRGTVVAIEEKPEHPRSPFAVPGLYVYGPDVVEVARGLEKSPRGELEITDVNRAYLDAGQLSVQMIERGVAWLDSGTHDSLLDAANFIATIEHRQSIKVACLEEIALQQGFIDLDAFLELVDQLPLCTYRDYLVRVAAESAALA
ncbi:MAG: glucose-1-phosphate thymidylyltransferase RfbA [Myxococcales bacterium]|nr:glucose-1-phosphate thymidylyltransferase RfbA [Myxococcales bacterium]